MAPKKDTRPAGVDGWKFRVSALSTNAQMNGYRVNPRCKARNALMFPPDADVSPYHPPAVQTAQDAKGPPKLVKHGNTRLPEQDDKLDHSISAPPSPTRSRIDAAIAGTPCK